MEIKDIHELWDRFESSSADEMSLSFEGFSFSLKKSAEVRLVEKASEKSCFIPKKPLSESVAEKEAIDGLKEIKAPLVGTFYRSPSPDAPPFVKVGDVVKKGDVLGIIEAMKIMNDITSTFSGRIAEIKAEDGKMAEYGQVLFVLEETDV